MTESELIAQARGGSEEAWDALVRAHQGPVFRLAYLLMGDAHEAEDIAQETFIRAFRALDRFQTDLPMRPWLLSITTNLARNRRRSVGRYLAAVRRFVQSSPEPVTSGGVGSTQAWEAETLWQAVRRLSQADQEVISMRYFLELSEAETAAALGVPPGTVKSRLHRALARLRVVVDGEYPSLREGRVE